MKTGPYVGITGIMSLHEMVFCEQAFRDAAEKADFALCQELKFMAGVLVSSKTLDGQSNNHATRFPPVGHLREIFALRRPHLLRTVHYNTDDREGIDAQLDRVLELAPGDIDALQLNISWVNPIALQGLRRAHPDLRIILQIGKDALKKVTDASDIYVGVGLKAYEGFVDDFLIDPSGGRGLELDVWKALACLVDKNVPVQMRGGVAGGLNPENLEKLTGLMRRHDLVNFDMESGTRTQNDDLDFVKAQTFLERGVGLMDRMYRFHRSLRTAA